MTRAEPGAVARATLVHRTAYTYEHPVRLGPQWLRLRPLPRPGVPEAGFRLSIDPAPLSLHWIVDPWGNHVARFALAGPAERLVVETELSLDVSPRNPFDFVLDGDAAAWPFRYAPELADALAPFRRADLAGPLLAGLLAEVDAVPGTTAMLLALGAAVRDRVAYVRRDAPGVWPPDRTLGEGQGSCRDSAWLLVQCLRQAGVAARFVSGYQLQRPGPALGDAELHAWTEAFLPGAGWIGIDATSGLLTAERHVAVAASPDPGGAAPLSGTVEAARVTLDASIVVSEVP